MLEHPGIELQLLLKEKGLTQKAFSIILGKKISEVNELLKGKRNITIQRDYLLHKALGTPVKYRILKQVDYEYSLLNIDENIDENNIQLNIQEDSQNNLNNIQDNIQEENFQENLNPELNKAENIIENRNITNNKERDVAKPEILYSNQKTNQTTENKQNSDIDNQDRIKIFRNF